MAKISLIGRLAAEAELTPTSDGTDMIRYSLATNSGTKENRKTSWWKIASFAGEGRGRDLLLSLGKGLVLRESFMAIYNFFSSKKRRMVGEVDSAGGRSGLGGSGGDQSECFC